MSASNTSCPSASTCNSSPPASCLDPVSFTESTNNSLFATIATKNADTDKPIFSNYTAVDSLVRNTNNPLHNLEGVTGIIAWNDRKYGNPKGTQLGGYAVTPRHIVSSRHAAYLKGDKVWFVARDNTLIERTVIAHRSPLYRSISYNQGDYVIGLLDSDLPASIEPLEVLPPDFYKYLDNTEFNDTTWKAKDVFFVHTNQKEQSLFSKLNNIIFKVFKDPDPLTYNPANAGYFQRARKSKNAISEWSGPVIGGDSGSPSMFIVGTKLIPFSVWSTATVGNFFGQARNYNDLNRLIVDTDAKAGISTGYTLTDIDMSEFRVYSQSVTNSKPPSPSVATCNVSCASSTVICNTSSPSPSVTPSIVCCISPSSSPATCYTPASCSCCTINGCSSPSACCVICSTPTPTPSVCCNTCCTYGWVIDVKPISCNNTIGGSPSPTIEEIKPVIIPSPSPSAIPKAKVLFKEPTGSDWWSKFVRSLAKAFNKYS